MEKFSQKLKKKREDLNLTIDEIADKTKIRHHFIKDIEKGNYQTLPDVYAKSFVRTYAQFLKIPEKEIESSLEQIFAQPEKTIQPDSFKDEIRQTEPEEKKKKEIKFLNRKPKEEKNEEIQPETRKLDSESLDNIFFGSNEKKGSKLKKNLKYIALSLVGVAAVIFIIILFMPDKDNGSNAFVKETDKAENLEDSANMTQKIIPDKITLVARALDTTSFKIHLDNQTDESITLYPGKSKQWEAVEKFELSGVTIGALELMRDNVKLEISGENGSRIRDLTIFKDRVVSSTVEVEEYDTTKTVNESRQPQYDE